MFFIGERINGMFKDVAEAIKKKDSAFIRQLVERQIRHGAEALDVNVGPSTENPEEAMAWLVKTISEVSDVPLAIDTTKKEVMEIGLSLSRSRPIINSVNANDDRLGFLFSLAKKYDASMIALTMDKSGIPKDTEGRLELAMKIIAFAVEEGFDINRLYIDPVILPVNVAQSQIKEVLRTIKESKMLSDPPPKTILGLSNVSQGSDIKTRALINRTFLAMAIGAGLDAAILDVTDNELMNTAITAELLMERQLYCDSYLSAYKKR